jgi:hypothetical protein
MDKADKITGRRQFYESLTITDLKAKCREKGLSGFSSLRKAEIVDLLMENFSPGSSKASSKAPSNASSKISSKTTSKVSKSIPVVSKPVSKAKTTKTPKKKDPLVEILEETSKIITNRTNDLLSQMSSTETDEKIKPSGLIHQSYLKSVMETIAVTVQNGDKAGSISRAEIVKNYLEKFKFDYLFEEQMRDSIKSVVDSFSDKKPAKKKIPAIRGDYSDIDVSTVIFTKTKSPKKRSISITLDELRTEIEDDSFIKKYTLSIKELMKAKVEIYLEKKRQLEKEYASISKKIEKLKSTGSTEKSIEKLYPDYEDLKCFAIELGELIDLVRAKSRDANEKNVKANLTEAIEDTDEGLASIVGRENLKNQIAAQIYSFSKGYRTFIGSFNNIAIYGSSGSGKTKLATVISFVFSKIGVLAKDFVKIVTRTDLVGQYIGQTGPRTKSVLMETLEGILFIDEAYQLGESPDARQGSRDFGMEALTEIVNFLDKYIGLNIVIVAGYENLMKSNFMSANEGLPRRFPYRYVLPNYSNNELTDILMNTLVRKVPDDIAIDGETSNYIYSIVKKLAAENMFPNQAGDMLNLATSLNKAIGGSFKVKWENGELGNNTPIILSGFEDFLETKV